MKKLIKNASMEDKLGYALNHGILFGLNLGETGTLRYIKKFISKNKDSDGKIDIKLLNKKINDLLKDINNDKNY